MKPAPFGCEAPASMAAAIEVLARHDGAAKVMAGGACVTHAAIEDGRVLVARQL